MSGKATIEERVQRAAAELLRSGDAVAPVDVLIRIGWLPAVHRDLWEQGRVESLDAHLQVRPGKVANALAVLQRWAAAQQLQPREVDYVARTRDRRALRFTATGDPELERAMRTHWISGALSEKQQERVVTEASRPPDLVVVSPLRADWTCTQCGGTGEHLLLEDAGPLCLTCADLDHLVFLPAGDATLTRRAKKASRLTAVVVRWNRSAKRYQRQGVLVEEEALRSAEESCLADAEVRARRRERDAERRAAADDALVEQLTAVIRRLFPGCPPQRAAAIAAHTAERGSGRVGRSAAGRRLDERALELAVVASVRHRDTRYDELLMAGHGRDEARAQVRADVDRVLDGWRAPATDTTT